MCRTCEQGDRAGNDSVERDRGQTMWGLLNRVKDPGFCFNGMKKPSEAFQECGDMIKTAH